MSRTVYHVTGRPHLHARERTCRATCPRRLFSSGRFAGSASGADDSRRRAESDSQQSLISCRHGGSHQSSDVKQAGGELIGDVLIRSARVRAVFSKGSDGVAD